MCPTAKVHRDRPTGPVYTEPMCVTSMRAAAAWLLALLMLALPHAVCGSGRAISRPDAPSAYTTPQDAKILRTQLLAVAKHERQRQSGGPEALAPSRAEDLLYGQSTTPASRLRRLAL